MAEIKYHCIKTKNPWQPIDFVKFPLNWSTHTHLAFGKAKKLFILEANLHELIPRTKDVSMPNEIKDCKIKITPFSCQTSLKNSIYHWPTDHGN